MVCWHFKPKAPGDTIREPIHGEFFATDAISDPGMALIREGIQNSLDAGREGEVVRVRVFLSGDRYAATSSNVSPYLEGARPHLEAAGNGLDPEEIPDGNEPCPFVLFEDFGTSGLEGDPAEPFRTSTPRTNHFYHFFRAEGQTDKGASERGSWGVGKHVFWRSSRISTVFAYTVRAKDRRRLLMGKSVLKCHWVNAQYCQDGYYGSLAEDGGQLVMPVEDSAFLDSFRAAFGLARVGEPGLSVVVPWPDADIAHESLLRSVVHDYFYPILNGQLEVTVETPSVRTSLDQSSLLPEIHRIGGALAEELEPVLELAAWARSVPESEKSELRMPDPTRAWKWDRSLFPDDGASALREKFERLESMAVKVPVTVRPKSGPAAESYYEVFLVRDLSDSTGRPTFIREGVIVPKVDAPRNRGVRALVVADHGPVAAFLRDAENPSHTEWQHDGSNFRGKYRSGRSDLTFVKRSVREIVRILTEMEAKEDRVLLADFFSLPAEEALRGRDQKPGDESGSTPPAPGKPLPSPQPFRVEKIQGGFALLPGDEPIARGILEIRAAYDVRRGNPLKRYRASDFRFDSESIRFDPAPTGVEVLDYHANRIVVEVLEPRFSLHLAGFDDRRDLYVKVDRKESFDVGPPA